MVGKKDQHQAENALAEYLLEQARTMDRHYPAEDVLEFLVTVAASVVVSSNGRLRRQLAAILHSHQDRSSWKQISVRELSARARQLLENAWHRGWEPVDVVTYTERFLGAAGARLAAGLAVEAVAGHAAATVHPRWHEQVNHLRAGVAESVRGPVIAGRLARQGWEVFTPQLLELVGLLTTLPRIETLTPPPGQFTARAGENQHQAQQVDQRLLNRIRAMLAKAAATTSQAEAEAFIAAAQERMARHSIDMALVQAAEEHNDPHSEVPTGRRIWIEPPYGQAKAILLQGIAEANRCRSIWSPGLRFCTIVGYDTDTQATELLFTSLLVQATTAMTNAGTEGAPQYVSSHRATSFRRSFLFGFARRISERLLEVTRDQTASAMHDVGENRLLPVLLQRKEDVDQQIRRMFPDAIGLRSVRVGDPAGRRAGSLAADQADITGARRSVQ
ncbi:DUF2786 domain-containing protein [Kineosporia sp. J2-2]|uniref:DUF2786 domain-containing protein n=1 Tax=Kineosporia corallincola TaxID=2835133 RepID=A0ABS5TTP4_9ACTN|nr:DUF2786 domain-containing protein [Kineosporia corallincola]MBT0774165.1 DUF2786 domain-containing protein [Kineosporia corallincola]